jgi:hypothetical protein
LKSAGEAHGVSVWASDRESIAPCDVPVTEIFVPRWLLILGAIALIALIAGYVTFGGANMGR